MQRNELKELGWPVNLLTEVFGELEYPITAERTALIEKAVTETLSEQESSIIMSHFQKLLTLREIGGVCGVGPERIRQIESKAIRKLRHPNRWARFFPKGFKDYNAQGGFKTLEEMDAADDETKHEEVEVIDQDMIIERVLRTIDSGEPISKEDFESMLIILPIEKLHEALNVRASNAIASCGIVNIVQLLYALRPIYKDNYLEANYLCSVRNIGHKLYIEIIEALDKLFKTSCDKYSQSFYNKYSHMKKYATGDKNKRIYHTEEALYKTPDKYWWYKCYPSGNMFEKINEYKKRVVSSDEEKKESRDEASNQTIVNGYNAFSLRYEGFHLPRLNDAYPYNLISTITRKEIEYISKPYGNIVTHFEDIIISAINRITGKNERLTNRLCYMLTLRFKYNKTYLEISSIMDIAPTAARETVDNIISTVRNYMNSLPYQYFPDGMFINEKER